MRRDKKDDGMRKSVWVIVLSWFERKCGHHDGWSGSLEPDFMTVGSSHHDILNARSPSILVQVRPRSLQMQSRGGCKTTLFIEGSSSMLKLAFGIHFWGELGPSLEAISLHSLAVLGNLLNRSLSWSIGAASKPAAVSNGGLSGALGWLRVGAKNLVRWKLRPNLSDCSSLKAFSRATRSCSSSSWMCLLSSSQRLSRVGRNSASEALRFWNL